MKKLSVGKAKNGDVIDLVALPNKYKATTTVDISMVLVGILFLCMTTAGPASGTQYAITHVAFFGSIGLFAFAFGLVRLLKYKKAERNPAYGVR